jgi:GNAT superfamily N-acetyltransferase
MARRRATAAQPPTDTRWSLSTHDDIPHDEGQVVDAGIGVSNDAAAPLREVRPLSCFARLPSGLVIGGAVGRTWGSCCELQQLWVAPEQRRQGLATRLLRTFEDHARRRACSTFYLETFSFQAPDFYRKLGYDVKLELRGFGPGICKYTMVHEFGAGESDERPSHGSP